MTLTRMLLLNAAPIAHILVSAITKYPAYKRPLLYAVGASTALMVINRLYLMGDAGYPGSEGGKDANKHWHEKITHGT